jgi:hypothetical protein
MIAGFVGLISLIVENWNNTVGSSNLHIVAYYFGVEAAVCALLFLGDLCCHAEIWLDRDDIRKNLKHEFRVIAN